MKRFKEDGSLQIASSRDSARVQTIPSINNKQHSLLIVVKILSVLFSKEMTCVVE